MINYLAITKKNGIVSHATGIKDRNSGFLFAGKSESGKSTLAKIYHKHSDTMILNDDRVIIRQFKNRFYVYGSPWHGTFFDYLESSIERARLKTIFFLKKSNRNTLTRISENLGFQYFYKAMFPTFWDKNGTRATMQFLMQMLKKIPCYELEFRKDKSIIRFIDKIQKTIK